PDFLCYKKLAIIYYCFIYSATIQNPQSTHKIRREESLYRNKDKKNRNIKLGADYKSIVN
ncbi:hypothetical protein, partial [Rodentibacter pneumotropicus]|uniref:hypothetical protein n=1 Tax=Rodentibacter pneumotropicus TaxID=758 RepID=UPI001C4DE969